MDDTAQDSRSHLRTYDALRANAQQSAIMCALYTDGGLYDLAKERAADWRRFDREARDELGRVIDEQGARIDRSLGQ